MSNKQVQKIKIEIRIAVWSDGFRASVLLIKAVKATVTLVLVMRILADYISHIPQGYICV